MKYIIYIISLALSVLVSCNTSNNSDVDISQGSNNVKDTVLISGMKFNPDTVKVKKGNTLVFVNQDIVPHNVVQKDSLWYSPILNSGDKWQYIVDKDDDFYCSLHLVMKGKIVIN